MTENINSEAYKIRDSFDLQINGNIKEVQSATDGIMFKLLKRENSITMSQHTLNNSIEVSIYSCKLTTMTM